MNPERGFDLADVFRNFNDTLRMHLRIETNIVKLVKFRKKSWGTAKSVF